MAFPLFLKLSVYLLVLDGLAALALTDTVSPIGLAGAVAAVGLSWEAERLRGRVRDYRRLWDVLTVIFLAYAVLDLAVLAESFVAAIVHLLLFLEVYKLWNLETGRDLLDLLVLTFLQLLAASTMTVSFAFLPIFCLYMLLAMWTLILLHLRQETEAALPDRSQAILAETRLVTARFLATTGGTAAVSLLLTVLIFLAIPRIGRSYLPFQNPAAPLTTGFSERVELGAYGSLQQDATIVMRVSFADSGASRGRVPALSWRGVAFDHFDGRAWSQSDPGRTPVRRLRSDAFLVEAFRPGKPMLAYEVFLEPIGTEVLFAAPRVLTLQTALPAVTMDAAGGLLLLAPPGSRIRYGVVSQPEPPPPAQLRGAGQGYPPAIRARYLQLPDLPPAVHEMAWALTRGAPSPYDAARRVEEHLAATLRYSLDLAPAPGRDPLEEFLAGRQAGNCEYFAAGMAVLLRAAGIPARVVNGFQRGEWNEVGQYFAVRQRDAHSWVEVYFPGAGWVGFDPTPRAAFESSRFGASGRVQQYFDALRMRWNRYVVDYNVGDQAGVAMRLRQQSLTVRRSLQFGWEAGWARLRAGASRGRHLLAAAAALAALGLAGYWLARRRPAIAEGARLWLLWATAQLPPVAFYERMLRLLARRGHARPPSLTAREFADGLAGQPVYEPVRELTALYERVRFGGEPLAPGEVHRAAELLRQLAAR
jgi:transglutaminase-like putative cysteine protease